MEDKIDVLALICIKDKKILNTKTKGKDMFYLPGGKREKGETDAEALTREIDEELNVKLLPGSIKLLCAFEAQAHGKPEGVVVRATCYTADFDGEPKASSEIAEIRWLSYADAEKTPPLGRMVFDWLHERGMLE